jgi:uncharacterized protein (DUF433 family)
MRVCESRRPITRVNAEGADLAVSERNGRRLLGVGLYTLPETARYLSFSARYRVSIPRLKRWMLGYKWTYRGDEHRSAGIVLPELCDNESAIVSFADLVELLYVAAFRQANVALPVIRAAHTKAKSELDHAHPFSNFKFFTYGKKIFRELTIQEVGLELSKKKLSEEVENSQLIFSAVVEKYRDNLQYVKRIAARFWPLTKSRSIVIDPEMSFGKPIEAKSRVPTHTIFAAHNAGESNEAIAGWFGIPARGVSDAISYEEALSRAA